MTLQKIILDPILDPIAMNYKIMQQIATNCNEMQLNQFLSAGLPTIFQKKSLMSFSFLHISKTLYTTAVPFISSILTFERVVTWSHKGNTIGENIYVYG